MKVNDYVRTKFGNIGKIIEQNEYNVVINSKNNVKLFISKEDNIKSSPNILDLIEIGDLVKIEYYSPRYHTRLTRLFEVEYKDNDGIRFCNSHCDLSIFHNQWLDKKMKPVIKSIVTKEMYANAEHRV